MQIIFSIFFPTKLAVDDVFCFKCYWLAGHTWPGESHSQSEKQINKCYCHNMMYNTGNKLSLSAILRITDWVYNTGNLKMFAAALFLWFSPWPLLHKFITLQICISIVSPMTQYYGITSTAELDYAAEKPLLQQNQVTKRRNTVNRTWIKSLCVIVVDLFTDFLTWKRS